MLGILTEIEAGIDFSKNPKQTISQLLNAEPHFAIQLRGGNVKGRIGFGINNINDSFGLGQIDAPI